jgi:hypothetical protein
MESKKIEQPAKSKVEACPPTTDSTLQVNGHGIDTGSANYPVSTSDPTNGMAKSSPQHSITGAPPGGHFNPKATHFAPKRHIPKNWYSQCRWTHPPGDNGRGVDNCRWGRRCDFGHPGEEYYEFPGIKNEFRNTSSIAPIGTVFVRPADPTVYSMNPRSMYQHLVQQRYGYSTYPNTPGYGGPMYYPSYGMPQMQPMQYPPVVLPVGIAYMERPNRNWTEEASPAKKQNEETSPAKKQDEIIIPGYNGPVIVRSPEPARPLPPGERMPKRSSSRESSKSSGSNSRSGGEPKSSDKSESDSNPEAPASDGVVSASNGEE